MGTVFCVYWTSTSLSTSILHIWYVFKQVCTTLQNQHWFIVPKFCFIQPPTVANQLNQLSWKIFLFLFLKFHCSTDATSRFFLETNPFIYWLSRELVIVSLFIEAACWHCHFPGWSWNIINFLSTAIHIVAHVFNVEFFISSYESDDRLVERLNMFEDSDNDTYLNPIRERNAVSKTFLFLLTQSSTGDRCSPPDVPVIACLFVLFCGTHTNCRLNLKSFYWLFVRFQLWCCGNLVGCFYLVVLKLITK